MVSAINSALSGLTAASNQFEASAKRIAGQNTPKPSGNQGSAQQAPDLDKAVVNSTIAAYDFKANLQTIKVADKMQQSLLDITT